MAYVNGNPTTKKQLKEMVANGNATCFQPGLGPDLSNYSGQVTLEGPHYPQPHKWYAIGVLQDGRLIKVK